MGLGIGRLDLTSFLFYSPGCRYVGQRPVDFPAIEGRRRNSGSILDRDGRLNRRAFPRTTLDRELALHSFDSFTHQL